MRIWSLHPRYLDPKGLVACWRESLLAREVLRGNTDGYRSHPQLARFREHPDPLAAIDNYLHILYQEACARGYRFDASKLADLRQVIPIPVSDGQLEFEARHLKEKLMQRAPHLAGQLPVDGNVRANPLFTVYQGIVEPWEVTK